MKDTLLEPEQINSRFLKRTLMHHLYWRLNCPIVVDEYNFMDVFAIRRSEYSVEFEIKVSKSDLLRETRLMRCDQPMRYGKDWEKWKKHASYLNRTIDTKLFSEYSQFMLNTIGEPTYFVPNEFCFYVPDFLVETAIKETEGTPYGVVKIGKKLFTNGSTCFDDYEVVKKATKIHSNKITTGRYKDIAHDLTIRNRLLQ